MEIVLNQQLVQIEVQDEKTAGELLKGIGTWLRSNGFSILEIRLNGKACLPGDLQWQGTPIGMVKSLEIDAPLLRELRHANLEILLEYLMQLLDSLKGYLEGNGGQDKFREYLDSFSEILPSAAYLYTPGLESRGSLEESLMANLRMELQDLSASAQKGKVKIPEFMVTHVSHLVLLTQERIRETLQPLVEARNTSMVLSGSLEELSQVSTQLMTGSEKNAFDSILKFSELLSKLLRIYWILLEEAGPGEKAPFARADLDSWTKKTNQTLLEISQAIENQDSVILGDLLEYELPDHIKGLTGLLG